MPLDLTGGVTGSAEGSPSRNNSSITETTSEESASDEKSFVPEVEEDKTVYNVDVDVKAGADGKGCRFVYKYFSS